MQSLLGIASKLPSRGLLTRFIRFRTTPLIPRFAPALNARRPIHTTFPTLAERAASAKSTGRGRTAAKKPRTAAKKKSAKGVKGKKKTVAAKKKPKKKKKVVAKAPPFKVTLAMAPPRGYPGPYILFWSKYIAEAKAEGRLTDIEATRQAARDCGETWRNLSQAERQPYFDQSYTLKEGYHKNREDYFKTTDPSVLRALNKSRRKRGRTLFRKPPRAPEDRKPSSSFFRFLSEFRGTEEAKGLSATMVARRAGQLWRELPASTKATYAEAFAKDQKAFKALHET